MRLRTPLLTLLGASALAAPATALAQPAATTSTSSAVRPAAGAASAPVSDRAVSFRVQNVNTSRIGCHTDGRSYTIRGRLVAPAGSVGKSTTLYLHGLGFGKFFYDFNGVPGYNYAHAQARAGLTSVVIDRLGYDDSGKPKGTGSCLGGQASIAHQIVGQLRSGTYRYAGGSGSSFRYVYLAGHSIGGLISQAEAYSYRDIDGLIVIAHADQGFSTAFKKAQYVTGKICAKGGQHVKGGQGPTGYAFLGQTSAAAKAAFFHDAEPTVIDKTLKLRNRDPCGDTGSVPAAIAADRANISRIHVPVLLVYAQNDALYPPPAGQRQAARYTGTKWLSLVTIPDTGHAVTLERSHNRLEKVIGSWLHRQP